MKDTSGHILIINPSEIALRLVKVGVVSTKSNEVFDVTVLITREHQSPMPSKEVFKEGYNANLIDLRREEWDSSLKFTGAVAYDFAGQSFLEGIQSQIVLNNISANPARIEHYYKQKPEVGEMLIEILSYNGRHVVVQGLKFNNEIQVVSNFDQSWDNAIEAAFEYLDAHEVINGSSQVYFDSNGVPMGLRLHPCNISYDGQLKTTMRHWWNIWPTVLMLKANNNPNIAFRKFYEWYLKTGKSSKRYYDGTEQVS